MSVIGYATFARNSHSALWMVTIGVTSAMNKQERWRLRNRLLWRTKGMVFPHYSVTEGIITEDELKLINTINDAVQKFIDNSVENSRKLGFKALYRNATGKILKDDPRNKDIKLW